MATILTGLTAICADSDRFHIGAPVTFAGMCDASAAVRDGDHMVVLNDEDGSPVYLRWFNLKRGGPPERVMPVSLIEAVRQSDKPEADIEAAAVIDNRLYLVGSHSRNKNGKVRVDRQILAAIKWPVRGPNAATAGSPYRSLLPDLQTFLRSSDLPELRSVVLDLPRPPHEGGVSIEAASATPDRGLFIGFRSPLVRAKALTVVVKNPQQVIDGQRPEFESPALLDLGGDGLRDALWHPVLHAYVLLTGPVGHGGSFGLYRWDGKQASPPRLLLRRRPIDVGVTDDVMPEAIAPNATGEGLWMFFDEGTRKTADGVCKAGSAQSFRGLRIAKVN